MWWGCRSGAPKPQTSSRAAICCISSPPEETRTAYFVDHRQAVVATAGRKCEANLRAFGMLGGEPVERINSCDGQAYRHQRYASIAVGRGRLTRQARASGRERARRGAGRDSVTGGRPPPCTKMCWRGILLPNRTVLPRDGNAQRSGAGWAEARDKLHGRVVGRRPVVEMARPVIAIRWSTGRASSPDPRPQARVSAFCEVSRVPERPLRRPRTGFSWQRPGEPRGVQRTRSGSAAPPGGKAWAVIAPLTSNQ